MSHHEKNQAQHIPVGRYAEDNVSYLPETVDTRKNTRRNRGLAAGVTVLAIGALLFPKGESANRDQVMACLDAISLSATPNVAAGFTLLEGVNVRSTDQLIDGPSDVDSHNVVTTLKKPINVKYPIHGKNGFLGFTLPDESNQSYRKLEERCANTVWVDIDQLNAQDKVLNYTTVPSTAAPNLPNNQLITNPAAHVAISQEAPADNSVQVVRDFLAQR